MVLLSVQSLNHESIIFSIQQKIEDGRHWDGETNLVINTLLFYNVYQEYTNQIISLFYGNINIYGVLEKT